MRILIVPIASLLIAPLLNGQPPSVSPSPGPQPAKVSADCTEDASKLAHGSTRVFIGQQSGKDGSGRSANDARDGSSVEKFDRILRCYSEGCAAGSGEKAVPKTEKLIACIGPGRFQTKGRYDFVINVPHRTQEGFTIGKGWKIHGAGVQQTTVQLSAYRALLEDKNPENLPAKTGKGVVFHTNSDDASGIEISDLTIDANYPQLKARATQEGLRALNLEAIQLRSNEGGHWIHRVNVINTAGEIGAISITYETFPVWIYSVKQNSTPADNHGNIIENVTMSHYGGGPCTAIAMANAVGEVRNNYVDGYQIGYGGWTMGRVWFHNNVAIHTEYGFNIDSLKNDGVVIESNQIIEPKKYGFVIGGGGVYTNFRITGNTVQIKNGGVIGLLFQGNVTESVIEENTFTAERSAGGNSIAIKNYSMTRQIGPNQNNNYQNNRIDGSLKTAFYKPSQQSASCFFGNVDEHGNPRKDLKDSHKGPCGASDEGRGRSPAARLLQ